MYFRVLGPIRVDLKASGLGRILRTTNGSAVELHLTGKRKQIILAMLSLNVGQTVPITRIVDAIWVDVSPPATAREQVQNCTAELRRALRSARCDGHSAVDCRVDIITSQRGYRLEADPKTVDAIRFDRLIHDYLSLHHHRDEEVCVGLREALALWTGPAIGDLPSVELQAEAAKLEDLRLLAVEELASRELRNSHMPGLYAATFVALTRRYPYRERLWLLQMEALHKSGRAIEALARYREYRTMLIAHHGMEPGPEIRAKESEILQSTG